MKEGRRWKRGEFDVRGLPFTNNKSDVDGILNLFHTWSGGVELCDVLIYVMNFTSFKFVYSRGIIVMDITAYVHTQKRDPNVDENLLIIKQV